MTKQQWENFKVLRNTLRTAGYKVTQINASDKGWRGPAGAKAYKVVGDKIIGIIWQDSSKQYRLCVDNRQCFNKWSQAPLRIYLDAILFSGAMPGFLITDLAFLSSEKGYEYSNEFQFLDNREQMLTYRALKREHILHLWLE
ncbi:MAG: hypothetical protein UY48_C0008G0014 [Candidatus Gottesmanbacteria bacterium GW2011_GWB1_49_7]|uniref:Uncharacterized protein n=1 Tax=Candidatus Gottesmanbacteria bacterium GW2011_GWB1_49_7 TaxID=1618448 RepID=A0A0G1Z265_9BACT|nr:MAG: hypothetical protein UY48_C0008G0014 [Candidatus Gottesmanbacteria bacterium GW2011_GWB1_49_7]